MRLYYSLFVLLLLSSCYNVERNCKDFKTGIFKFKYTIDGVEKTGKFIRTDDLNIDMYEGKVDTSSVRWINDCEFILKKINPKTNADKDAIHMKILTTSNNSYTFEYKLAVKKPNRPQRTEIGTATKID
ncbi:MAG: hypothetical protein HRU50_03075 [Winogradskyella sp.]|uniref:hypothetical protein n=1 Tax=Winogradskyella sp. TaxID=1883156 RepID=UPI0025DA8622|nr:hypothetical protein [Winogradskyella sp.]NRB58906.1 hypothetical protein [Winogradskyella sp.]